jgi:hypothetical protein
MLSRAQQILLKRAQREAGLSDDDYRDALETIAACRSSKDSRLTDEHLDKLLAYFEAIYFRAVDSGVLHPACKPGAVFRQRGYWAAKNTRLETSRDRYSKSHQGNVIAALEARLAAFGCNSAYCAAIRANVCKGRTDGYALRLYQVALERTLKSKARRQESAPNPF